MNFFCELIETDETAFAATFGYKDTYAAPELVGSGILF